MPRMSFGPRGEIRSVKLPAVIRRHAAASAAEGTSHCGSHQDRQQNPVTKKAPTRPASTLSRHVAHLVELGRGRRCARWPGPRSARRTACAAGRIRPCRDRPIVAGRPALGCRESRSRSAARHTARATPRRPARSHRGRPPARGGRLLVAGSHRPPRFQRVARRSRARGIAGQRRSGSRGRLSPGRAARPATGRRRPAPAECRRSVPRTPRRCGSATRPPPPPRRAQPDP